jgi:hypothetical protein
MNTQNQHLDTLQDIKKMMERSSRFISLSGLSGIAAGCCALVGAWFAHNIITGHRQLSSNGYDETTSIYRGGSTAVKDLLGNALIQVAAFTFIASVILAFIFTYLRSKKTGTPIWGVSSQRLMVNFCTPLSVGGIFLMKLLEHGTYGLIAPGCLIFYGLALVNASKYTLGEVRYLGYGQIILGIINLWFVGYGLYFWAAGFGLLHIVYGAMMWWKYERN